MVAERRIGLGHFAADRCVHVRRGLDGFHHRRFAAFRHLPPRIGKLDEDDVAELALREIGDADGRAVALDADPLMLLGIVNGHWPPPLRWYRWGTKGIGATFA